MMASSVRLSVRRSRAVARAVLLAGVRWRLDPPRAGGRLRLLRSDGTVETVARGLVDDIAVLADATVVLAQFDGRLYRMRLGSRSIVPYLRPARPTGTFDFAGRSTYGKRLAVDPAGGLLATDGNVLRYLPRGPTPWTLAALRSTRPRRGAVTAVIETTQPGAATLEVLRRGRVRR